MENRRKTGKNYEERAAEYLIGQGFSILCQNFYSRYGEIDLIAKDGEYLVFVEVKYRKNRVCGSPFEAVNANKQRRICRTAFYYCYKNGYKGDTPCRFDVVAILGSCAEEAKIEHIKNAFEFQR